MSMLKVLDNPKSITKMLWTPTSKNPKTGNIPQGYVGQSRELAKASCDGCPLLQSKECYHWGGSSQMGQAALQRANVKDNSKKRECLETTLEYSVASANYIRLAVGGDPNVFTRDQLIKWAKTVKSYGLKGMLGYTHFPQGKGKHLKGLVMASCDDLAQVDTLVEDGWRVAVILPAIDPTAKPSKAHKWIKQGFDFYKGETYTTPKGRKITICPSQLGSEITLRNGRKAKIDCNNCGMCDATKNKGGSIIGFLMH